jgi:adenylate cyclase
MPALPDTWHALSRLLLGEPEFTGPEVAQQAGVDMEQARRLWTALGFPPIPDGERFFTRSDVAMLSGVCRLRDALGTPDSIIQLTRVTGQALARVADAQVATSAGQLDLSQLAAEPEQAVNALVDRFKPLLPMLEPFLGYAWRRHLVAAMFRVAASGSNDSTREGALAVGFADLVGFTAISQQLDERELASMVDRFEALAYEQITRRGGRVVKMIGDEVMFTADVAAVAAEIALALVDTYASDPTLPEVRVGLALGPTLSFEGDLFGSTVNLASRLVNIARPGTALVSDELAALLRNAGAFTLRSLRPLRLKGIGRAHVWVLRPAKVAAAPSPPRA